MPNHFYYLVLLLSMSLSLSAQWDIDYPEGTLYLQVHGQDSTEGSNAVNIVGYVDYPFSGFNEIDTLPPADLYLHEHTLFITPTKPLYTTDPTFHNKIYCFDTDAKQITDTIEVEGAFKTQVWDNQLVVLSNTAPHFRVFDRLNDYAPLYELEADKVNRQSDILVSEGKAYMPTGFGMQVVDLTAQDTIGMFPYAPGVIAFWPGAGFPVKMVDTPEKIYIDIEYATNAIRFSIISFNKNTQEWALEHHQEGYANWSPSFILANSKIFLSGFNSHFDLSSSNLFLDDNNDKYPIAYDAQSNTLFLIKTSSPGTTGNITELNFYHFDGAFYSPILEVPPVFLQWSFQTTITPIVFHSNILESVKEYNLTSQDVEIQLFPNPVGNQMQGNLMISWKNRKQVVTKIRLLDLAGRVVDVQNIDHKDKDRQQVSFSINQLPKGIYLVEVHFEKSMVTKKMIVE